MPSKKPGNGGNRNKELDFHYVKTHNYRSYHVDGIFGGIAPNGNLYMEIFIERLPTPEIIKHRITPEGALGEEIGRTGKDGLIREIEAGLVMSIKTAQALKVWLEEKLAEAEIRLKKGGGLI